MEIKEKAFFNCPLEEVVITKNLKRIEDYAFYSTCETAIEGLETVEYVGKKAFGKNAVITNIEEIDAKVTENQNWNKTWRAENREGFMGFLDDTIDFLLLNLTVVIIGSIIAAIAIIVIVGVIIIIKKIRNRDKIDEDE